MKNLSKFRSKKIIRFFTLFWFVSLILQPNLKSMTDLQILYESGKSTVQLLCVIGALILAKQVNKVKIIEYEENQFKTEVQRSTKTAEFYVTPSESYANLIRQLPGFGINRSK